MFTPSIKKVDPEKAGRFNIGEKFVLAFCRDARIETTTGTVIFDGDGRHEHLRRKRERGTLFVGLIDCNEERLAQFEAHMRRLLVKSGLRLKLNGVVVPPRKPFASFDEILPTEIPDDKGNLRPSRRKTVIDV